MDETAFNQLISGERRGVLPALQRGGLSVLSLFYGLGVRLRNRAFDLGLKSTHAVGVPVISVGNITTGGTGKTPLVAYLANWFRERDVNVALLSRGYRSLESASGAASARRDEGETSQQSLGGLTPSRSPMETANDEKLVLERLCPGVPHWQQPDRVASARSAVEQHGAELLILDDGFQHRRLHRNLNIVLIDALNPFGFGRLLPRGLLREPLPGLRRADVIILSRADQCSADENQSILTTVRRFAPQCDVAEVAFRPDCLINAAGETQSLSALKGEPVTAFCGIGNPESFRRTLSDCDTRSFLPFPDHHHYTQAVLQQIADAATSTESAAIVTTLKDLVKVDRPEINGVPVWAVQISADFLSGGEKLQQRLGGMIS